MQIISYGTTLTGSTGVNGDSYYISPDNKVFVLSDGASGAGKNGKVIMSSTCAEIAKQYDYSSSNLAPEDYVDVLFWKINNKLIELSQNNRNRLYGTIIIAVIDKDILTVTTFGDSPIFLFSDGKTKRIAKNKKRYEDMIEQGFITKDEYEGYIKQMHPRMGACFDYFLPEVVPNNVIEQYSLTKSDIVFMCCDGLSDWVTPENILTALNEYGIENGVQNLVSNAKELSLRNDNYYDDITAIAIHYSYI